MKPSLAGHRTSFRRPRGSLPAAVGAGEIARSPKGASLPGRRSFTHLLRPSLVLFSLFAGLLISYLLWAPRLPAKVTTDEGGPAGTQANLEALRQQVNPPEGFPIGVSYGDLGPRLLAAGVIDYDAFARLYDRAGQPLRAAQIDALVRGSNEEVVITAENAYFLLNFFWAVGLANRNSILADGAMTESAAGRIDRFASTGGWSIATRPVQDLYASLDLISLTPEQQQRVEEVAASVYRPCCDNPTSFPDCNHGMAMLGILELMASRNATPDEMFMAAKHVNAFWFPDQALETALYLKIDRGIDFTQADPRLSVGAGLASGSGFSGVHAALQRSGLLPQASGGSGSCAN